VVDRLGSDQSVRFALFDHAGSTLDRGDNRLYLIQTMTSIRTFSPTAVEQPRASIHCLHRREGLTAIRMATDHPTRIPLVTAPTLQNPLATTRNPFAPPFRSHRLRSRAMTMSSLCNTAGLPDLRYKSPAGTCEATLPTVFTNSQPAFDCRRRWDYHPELTDVSARTNKPQPGTIDRWVPLVV